MCIRHSCRRLKALAVSYAFIVDWQGQSYKQNFKSKEMEEIFARTLEVVSGTTDVSPELILSKDRHEEVVDARCLLIFLLYAQGMYPSCISRKTGVSTRGVNYCTARFHDRLRSRNYLRNIYETTRKILGINC